MSPATIADFFKTSTTPGTAVALGASTIQFQSVTFLGYKSAGVANVGNVKVRPVGGEGWVIVAPQTDWSLPVPRGTFFNAAQFEIDVDNSGDGVYVLYGSAVVYAGA
jgi:hypothetical protein